jgi:hypothetical protein
MPDSDQVAQAISDMKFDLGAGSDRELAEALGIDPTAVSAWRRRCKIPDKYKVRFARIKDEQPFPDPIYPPDFHRLMNAYLFALVRMATFNLEKKVHIPRDNDYMELWSGFRLHRLYGHAAKALRACPAGDKDKLRRIYQELRSKIDADDLYEWIETLPEPL